jgi:hypothetical protein
MRSFYFSGALVALSLPLHADTTGPGWGQDFIRVLTAQTAFASHDTLANGDRIVYDGSTLWREQDDGTVTQILGSTTANFFATFVEVDPAETFVVFGESSTGGIYRVPLASPGGMLFPIAALNFNYDLAFEAGGNSALVSAATCGFGCGNEIHRLDLSTGATTLVAGVTGPSGPLAFSAAGDLYYAVQSDTFPTPPGAVSLVRWSAAQVASGPYPLTLARANLFTPGLDGGSSLAFDPQYGHLFLGESNFGATSRVIEIDRFGAVVGEVASSPDFMGKVEVFDAPGDGVLGAFQPAGARLQYRTTEFNQVTSQIVRVSPRRPELSAVQNGDGTMTVSLSGATPGTSAFVISGPAGLYSPTESATDLVTYLFWSGIPFGSIRRAGIQFLTDATGAGTFTFQNPPPIQGTRVIQVLVRDAQGVFRGTSTAVFN